MIKAAITILGLGPGCINNLTLQAYDLLAQAASKQQIVYFRTTLHPTIDPLKEDLPALQIASFDHLYDEAEDWHALYQQIAEEICTLAAQQPIIYAVPGHPLIGETSVQLILQLAGERNLSTAIVAGLSFLEPVCTVLKLDPFDAGMQIVEASSLTSLHAHEIAGKIIPTSPLLITQIYNRRLASQVKLALGECYPDEWQVKLVRGAGSSDDNEASIEMPLYELDRNSFANHLSTLYVPPLDEMTALRLPATTRFLTMRLRRDPDGCPWDRAQTHQSLTRYVIEETYEVVEALEENDMEKLAEELGDLLLQVYLHAEIACQQGIFAIGDVHEQLNAKLIRRHPHVFGTVEASNAEQVAQTWEAIKRQERAQAGKDVHKESILNGVPLASPALIVAQEYQKRALKAGFEFSSIERVYAKIDEELKELLTATSPEEQHEEFGDLLFIVVQLACWLKLDAEAALRASNRKFRKRFQAMEELASQRGQTLTSLSLQQWREFWHKAKEITR